MFKPAYQITIGNNDISTASGQLLSLDLRRSKNGAADALEMHFARDWGVSVADGDSVAVSLGWEDDVSQVFGGTVDEVRKSQHLIKITARGTQARLMATRKDATFLDQKAGEVVTSLASEVEMETDRVDDGVVLPFYLVDSTRNLYEHCLQLAGVCGFDLYATVEGKLFFGPFTTTSSDHSFTYGEHILAHHIEKGQPYSGITVIPESPASSEGEDAAGWLVKDAQAHSGIAGKGGFPLSGGVLRTKEAAESAARGRLAASQRMATHGSVVVMGNPAVKLGQAVALVDTPDADSAAIYQVVGINHRLSMTTGFVTTILVGGMPDV